MGVIIYGRRLTEQSRSGLLAVLAAFSIVFLATTTAGAAPKKPRKGPPSKPPAAAPAPSTPTPPMPEPAPTPPPSEIVHTPPAEQVVLTAVPIYAELPQGVSPAKVFVSYKPFGAPEWRRVELRRLGPGYGGEIPCQAVGSATGDLWYYIQAVDSSGEVLVASGSRKAPHKVPIQNELTGEAPHLPGRPPSKKCSDKADCPPGFPGCSGSAESKSCETSSDCGKGQKCSEDKVCQAASSSRKRFWIGAHVQQDFAIVKGQQDVCGNPTSFPPSNFDCIDEEGFRYLGAPDYADTEAGTGNQIKGGPVRSTLRLMLDVSYLLGANVSIGVRGGYVLNTAPGRQAAKYHGELRLAYWFGADPFAKESLRPYVAVMGGLAEVDDKYRVQVYETLCTTDIECATPPNQSLGLTPNPTLTVWRHSGGSFVGASIGLMIPTLSSQGIMVELKGQEFFPFSTFTLSPAAGYAVGF